MPEYPVEVDTVDTGIRELAPIQEFQNFGGGRTVWYHMAALVRDFAKRLAVADPEPTQRRAREAGDMDISMNLAQTRRPRSCPAIT